MPVKDEYLVTTSEFDRVKSRLIAIDNKLVQPGAASASGAKRPSLKRKTNTNRSEEEKPTLKSDRPTLKRQKPDDPDPDPGALESLDRIKHDRSVSEAALFSGWPLFSTPSPAFLIIGRSCCCTQSSLS